MLLVIYLGVAEGGRWSEKQTGTRAFLPLANPESWSVPAHLAFLGISACVDLIYRVGSSLARP